ncbi:Rid family hydrolase [Shinella sumterensis]|uniref:Rid family hydrolase n=1 Tax=Shinella sumterensis TaxID=1967501 RepID=A0AA50HHV9_9HYPH|nr:Rid family hydrolase [Shinella sumterensis]WLS01043.1 Rid family hydrolase [Shinella sumterensis]WLS11825.1 Rid family hydrolase [Shinella sumterensis]
MGRRRADVKSAWGKTIGYSRAIRTDDTIYISGTTATEPTLKTAEEQAASIFATIGTTLQELGGDTRHVVETKIYLKNIDDWKAVGRVHGDVFRDVRPATTILQVDAFVSGEALVEISAIAKLPTRVEAFNSRHGRGR